MVSVSAFLLLLAVTVAAASLVCGAGSRRGAVGLGGRAEVSATAGGADCLLPVNDVNHVILACGFEVLTLSKQPDACC